MPKHLPTILATWKIDWRTNRGSQYAPLKIPVLDDVTLVNQSIKVYEALLSPVAGSKANADQFTTILKQLAAVFPVQDIGQEGQKLRGMAFMDVFRDTSVHAFTEAAREYIRTQKFYPMPAEMLELSKKYVDNWERKLDRAHKLIDVHRQKFDCKADGKQVTVKHQSIENRG